MKNLLIIKDRGAESFGRNIVIILNNMEKDNTEGLLNINISGITHNYARE